MVTKKRGLGKGLSALIPNNPINESLDGGLEEASIWELNIEFIEPNQKQPRQIFDEEALNELIASIKTYGVIQPIVVRKEQDKYIIVAGERRWRAAKAAKLKKIPCIIKEINEEEAMKLALIENIQRQDLNPIEEAYAFRGLMEEYYLTQEEVAAAVGKSRSYVANAIRLLRLDKEIKNYIVEGQISSGHGRALLGIRDKQERRKMAESIVNNKTNVRDTESIIKKTKQKSIRNERQPIIEELEDDLMRILGTKVKLITKRNGGKIEIEFYDHDDLQRLIDLIMD